jgi:predicted MPP superfamily phosphohydrolase
MPMSSESISEVPSESESNDAASQALAARKFSRRKFLRRTLAGAATAAGGALFYTWRIEPHWVEVVQQSLPIAHLPDALVGKRLIQVSDLHVGTVVDQSYLVRSLESIAELRPDLVVVTGDFMTCHGDEQVGRALEAIRALPPAPLGRFAVLGNHDYGDWWQQYGAADKLVDGLESLDVRVLRNQTADAGGLQLAGVDDLWSRDFRPERALADLDASRPAIVLLHNPDGVDQPVWGDFHGWILAGHTHGGQCKPPFLPPPVLPVSNKRYVAGEYVLSGGRRMYINRGLGYLERVRFNCRPEITVFTLERADA